MKILDLPLKRADLWNPAPDPDLQHILADMQT